MYAVGIDLGTTYTSAAVWRDGRVEMVSLGSRSAAIPSAVFLRTDGEILTGEAASRRGLSEPDRVVRQLKRRLGDTAPILLGGAPYSATALTARLLRSVLDLVSAREGGPPASVCITHPAAWGPYKMDLLHQVVRLADLDGPVRFSTEPQAAACFHAQQKRLGPGAVVAVYDLGGGIFEAAVLRKTSDGFDLTGEPEANERLGGIELDDAIFAHVTASAGGALDPNEPAAARLRAECVQAKEALSADTDAVIPVPLSGAGGEVRLTRAELEALVRPLLADSIEALRRTVRSAGYTPQSLGSVLLVGGSSRMPIVAQMVSSGLGRPVQVNASPDHAVALGAAWQAGSAITGTAPASASPAAPTLTDVAASPAASPLPEVAASTVVARLPEVARTPASAEALSESTGEVPVLAQSVGQTPTTGAALAAGPTLPRRPLVPAAGFAGRAPVGPAMGADPVAAPPAWPPAQPAKPARRRVTALAAAAAAVLVLATGGTAWALTRPRGPKVTAAAAVPSSAPVAQRAAAFAADEKCTAEMKMSARWVCLTKATLHGNTFTVWYQAEWHGSRPDIKNGFHLHIYGGDGASPDESTMGSQVVKHSKYYFEDQQPSVRKTSDPDFQAIGDAEKVCARIADSGHGLAKAYDGSYHTGNCIPIQRY
ncbi:Hsp70 family protein [Actinoplanes sp. KI2]|uniref:Hsp70 family protein n=1 Tax=Actinoplanes sp. KI2 TaxID=2983315 RepID=UPI0021D5A775|nr:Hsp70 family protein [Actinoplanes sp. KI2]MCU7727857.1 Hsp70 family protein [Actinoplanes sp. KI2]